MLLILWHSLTAKAWREGLEVWRSSESGMLLTTPLPAFLCSSSSNFVSLQSVVLRGGKAQRIRGQGGVTEDRQTILIGAPRSPAEDEEVGLGELDILCERVDDGGLVLSLTEELRRARTWGKHEQWHGCLSKVGHEECTELLTSVRTG
jgi:hypothetical protein